MLGVEIAEYLEDQAVGTVGTNLFIGRLPETPDAAIGVFEYSGAAPRYVLGTANVRREQPRFQVLVRNTTYAAARLTADTVFDALDHILNQTIEGVLYTAITPLQSPFFLERDAQERVLFACNYEALKDLS